VTAAGDVKNQTKAASLKEKLENISSEAGSNLAKAIQDLKELYIKI
jgi:hypothetical protein